MLTAEQLADTYGMLSIAEVRLLKRSVQQLSINPVIINIGANIGTSAIAILEARTDAFVFSVDKKACPDEGNHLALSVADSTRCIRILGDSRRVGIHFPYNVEMVFFDGDHKTEALKADIKVWLPRILPKGIAVFHEYKHPNVPELTKVVDKAMQKYTLIGEERYLIAFKK